ncbi:FAD-dependent oxidoreductase [Isoalcanivorax indicus]|uniref:FAD-dependent oxidoreductase n=1 Tax=Isoalcanivorax indicus TaxID=2202653 RepID=UPI001FECFF57|nr:FAD-dependent oxidoreductase [Isoalcanivorax indicus]
MDDTSHLAGAPALRRADVARALAEALFPAGAQLPAPDPEAITRTVTGYVAGHPWLRRALDTGLGWLTLRCLLRHGQRFSHAPVARRRALLDGLAESALSRHLLRAVCAPFKAAYVLDEAHAGQMAVPRVQVPAQLEQFRWQQQITTASQLEEDQTLEADVVVIGSGAGGAAAAYELASRGLAVVVIEEGQWHDRRDFNGKLPEVISKLYRGYGATVALGNVFIPVPIGRCVGGTTTINSGTCMRTPDAVLRRWRDELGLAQAAPDELAPWFDAVEAMLKVQPAESRHVGPIGDIIERGARALGFSQLHPLRRNAEGCDGQGLCQFGCPTDAKQSTNVSYMPRALERGAFLFTGFRATRLLRRGQQALGVIAKGRNAAGQPVQLTVHARSTVVAMGTFLTPGFLRDNGVRNRHLGRHLTLHPCGVVNALFPDDMLRNARSIPQGFGMADLAEEGLMFEGGTIPFAGHGLMNNLYGDAWVRFTERYQQTAYFGFMIRDTSEGRVRRGPHRDLPWISYHMNESDFALFLRGIETLARIYLAAGAREVMIPGLTRLVTVRNEAELAAFMARRHRPGDFLMSAYHPLGTARLAADPHAGVCAPDHSVHGWQDLYVMDGSCVPSSLGANPQVTIMTLASHAAARLADHLTP